MSRLKASEKDYTKASTRNALIAAAIEEFCDKGFDAAKVDAISVKAGFAKGTVYNYFADKEALYLAAIGEVAASHVGAIERGVLAVEGAEARLEAFFRAGFAYVEGNPERAGLAIAALHGPRADFKDALGADYAPLFGFVALEIVAKGIAAGDFAACDPMETAGMLMTFYLGCAAGAGKDGRVPLDPALPFRFALRALEARG